MATKQYKTLKSFLHLSTVMEINYSIMVYLFGSDLREVITGTKEKLRSSGFSNGVLNRYEIEYIDYIDYIGRQICKRMC